MLPGWSSAAGTEPSAATMQRTETPCSASLASPSGPRSAQDTVVDGLRRLEYRGYDSAGVALVTPDGLAVEKRAGKLANLEKVLDDTPLPVAGVGIGHTRPP